MPVSSSLRQEFETKQGQRIKEETEYLAGIAARNQIFDDQIKDSLATSPDKPALIALSDHSNVPAAEPAKWGDLKEFTKDPATGMTEPVETLQSTGTAIAPEAEPQHVS